MSRGTLSYRDGRLEKTTDWPQAEQLEVDRDRVIITTGTEAPRVVDLANAPPLRTLLDAIRGPLAGDLAALQRGFVPTLAGGWDGWTLDLVPRQPGLLRSVHLDGRGDAVLRIAVTQDNGDDQVMTIAPQ